MSPTTKRIERPTIEQMEAAIASLQMIEGHSVHPIATEAILDDECDQLRFRFRLGPNTKQSATYTFTFTSQHSIIENLVDLEEFVREQYLIATHPPD